MLKQQINASLASVVDASHQVLDRDYEQVLASQLAEFVRVFLIDTDDTTLILRKEFISLAKLFNLFWLSVDEFGTVSGSSQELRRVHFHLRVRNYL